MGGRRESMMPWGPSSVNPVQQQYFLTREEGVDADATSHGTFKHRCQHLPPIRQKGHQAFLSGIDDNKATVTFDGIPASTRAIFHNEIEETTGVGMSD